MRNMTLVRDDLAYLRVERSEEAKHGHRAPNWGRQDETSSRMSKWKEQPLYSRARRKERRRKNANDMKEETSKPNQS